MTALPDEVEGAIAEGAEILELHAPERIQADENGKVTALIASKKMAGLIKGGRAFSGSFRRGRGCHTM